VQLVLTARAARGAQLRFASSQHARRPALATPKVKAVVYFDRVSTPAPDPCNWIVDSSPQAQAGFAAAGADPYLNQPHG
jgi:hypothetical protein